MDDTPYREFFARPTHPYHRRYEALRAVFLDGRSQKEVAEHFGYRYSTLRQLVYEFRQHGHDSSDGSPFFESRSSDARPRRAPPRGRGSQRPPRTRRPTWRTVGNWSCRSRSRCA
jgi:transposase-like protein